MLRERTPIGVILFRRWEVRPFYDKQIALLETFADQAVIAIENVRLFEAERERTLALAQANRDLAEREAKIRRLVDANIIGNAIVIGPPAGEYPMRTIPFQNQAWRAPDPAQQIATIVASGAQAPAQVKDAEIMRQRVQVARWIDEIRTAPIARRRTLDYSRTDDRKIFMICGQVVDEDRIDQTVKLGDTEEWTVVNTDQQQPTDRAERTGAGIWQ